MVTVHHWDVFTRQPGKGNPAGIVLDAEGLSESDMQAVATGIGFNDTAFVLPSSKADFRLRYFSPKREVDLCGHATVAALCALSVQQLLPAKKDGEPYMLETKAGILPIFVEMSQDEAPLVIMTQGICRFSKFTGDKASLAQAIGISVTDLHQTLPIIFGSTGRWTLLVPVGNLDVMRHMRPYPEEFVEILGEFPGSSIHPFCLETIDPRARAHARHFSSPSSGTVEDAVTGTASGVLGAYFSRFIAGSDYTELPLLIEQGYEMNREGTVQVWATKQGDEYSMRIAGSACFICDISASP